MGPYPAVVWVRTTKGGHRYRLVQVAPESRPHAFQLEVASSDAMGGDSWRTIAFSAQAFEFLNRSFRGLRDLIQRYL